MKHKQGAQYTNCDQIKDALDCFCALDCPTMQCNGDGGAATSWRKLKLIVTNGETARERPGETKLLMFLIKVALNGNVSKA